jgi:hypothetical protein
VSSRLLLLLLVGLLVAGALAAGRPQPAASLPPRLADVERATARWRTAGLVLGVAVAATAAQTGGLGRGLMLAGPLLALCVLLGVVVGELRVTAPPAGERTALLEVRRVRDYLPHHLAGTVLTAALLLSALLATTTAMGSADDLGRDGRSLAYQCGALLSGTVGPWAGSFYSLPLAAVVALGLLVAAVALRAVVRRPRQGADLLADDVLRRRAAQTVTAAAGLLVVVPFAGVALTTAAALRAALGNGALDGVSCAPEGWQGSATVLLLLVPVLLAVGVWCAGVLLGGTSPAVARR